MTYNKKNNLSTPFNVGIRELFVFLFGVCIAFSLIYNVSFKVAPMVTTGRVAVLLMFLFAILFRKIKLSYFFGKELIFIALFPIALIQFYFASEPTQVSRIFHLWFYGFFGAALLAAILKTEERILWAFVFATSIQSFFIFFVWLNQDLRTLLDYFIVTGGNIDIYYIYRSPGFAGFSGSALSVTQVIGVLSSSMLLKKYSYKDGVQTTLIILMVLCVFSTIPVGRTGFIVSLLFMLWFFVVTRSSKIFKKIIYISLIAIMLTSAYLKYTEDVDFSQEYFQSWAFGFFTGDNEIATALIDMQIPSISTETFFGTGLVRLDNGLNASGHDSGYIQSYYSLGLFPATFLYISFIYIFLKVGKIIDPLLGLPIVFIIFFIEIKEPFIFKYSLPIFFMTIFYTYKYKKMNEYYNSNRLKSI